MQEWMSEMLIFATEQSEKTGKRVKKKKSLEGSVQKIGSFGVKDRMFYGERSDLLSGLHRGFCFYPKICSFYI